MSKKMFFISGLPRSGSTLLTSILSQNPKIHTEGNSALCQLMWDMKISFDRNCYEQLSANNKIYLKKDLITSLKNVYYSNTNKEIIIDKCRTWTTKENLNMIKEYIDPDPKIIVLIRDIEEIVKSFKRIGFIPSITYEEELFIDGTDPLMRPLSGILYSMNNNSENLHILNYENFISNTDLEIKKIYSFLELDYFEHNLNHIEQSFFENDSIYGINNMHVIRSRIKKEENNMFLKKSTIEKCHSINKLLFKN